MNENTKILLNIVNSLFIKSDEQEDITWTNVKKCCTRKGLNSG